MSLGHVPSKKFCDIVGSLPLELVLQIVEYLDPADIVRSQRVGIARCFSRFRNLKGHFRLNWELS